MCGIFGYYTFGVKRNVRAVLDTLFNGLKRLEYRGYDSAGLALDLVDTFQAADLQGAGQNGHCHHLDSCLPLIVKEVRAGGECGCN